MAMLVALAGGFGALLRVLVGRAVVAATHAPVAAGTFVVNTTGALAMGLLVGIAPSQSAQQLVGVGLLGGYTTFSSWMVETVRLASDGSRWLAALNLMASTLIGLAAIWVGRLLAGG